MPEPDVAGTCHALMGLAAGHSVSTCPLSFLYRTHAGEPDVAGTCNMLTGGGHGAQVEAEERAVLVEAAWSIDAFARHNPTTSATVTPIYCLVFMRKPLRHLLDTGVIPALFQFHVL